MIKIDSIKVVHAGGKVRLTADISVNGRTAPLWFEVEERYAACLCPERCDAYVLAVLHYGMRYGHDVECDVPMTDRLYEQLVGQFLPAFYKANVGHCHPARIVCPIAPEVEHSVSTRPVVATGVSCGVDSLHVFARHPEITHGCIWNGHGRNWDETDETRNQTWFALVDRARRFSQHMGIELVIGNSNFDHGCIPEMMWDGMTTNGNLFCVFALQKLWSKYYIASDCAANIFKFNISLAEDPAHYEFFMFPFVTLSRLQVLMDGADCKRIEKIRDLVDFAPARKFLNTCWRLSDDHHNCSHECPKCIRTMLGFWIHGALERFAGVYDVDYFHSHKSEYLAEVYRGCLRHDFFAEELMPYLKKMPFSLTEKVMALFIVSKKIVGKILRLGKTSQRFSSR